VRTAVGSGPAAGLGVVVLALGLTACGGVDDSGADALTTRRAGLATVSAGGSIGTEVTARESDDAITLSETSLTVGTHTFVVRNTGSVSHSLTIEGPGGVDPTSDTVDSGGSTTLTVTLQAGDYELYCPIGDQRAMGMETTLRVR
jgi:plastocyanin